MGRAFAAAMEVHPVFAGPALQRDAEGTQLGGNGDKCQRRYADGVGPRRQSGPTGGVSARSGTVIARATVFQISDCWACWDYIFICGISRKIAKINNGGEHGVRVCCGDTRNNWEMPMCNRYGNNISYGDYVKILRAAKIPLVSPTASNAPNLEPRDNIAPTDKAPVLRPVEGGLELVELRWGLIPSFHKKPIKEWKVLTTNARSETITTTVSYKTAFKNNRCLVPLDQFYEWTGEKGKKTKWSFTRADNEWFCFAGIWDRAETADGIIESYALVTVPAGADVSPYHDRQPIILERSEYKNWLSSDATASQLFKPAMVGSIIVRKAENLNEEDWLFNQMSKGKWV
jgi:putative SOS response-associated peptidase YedK